MKKTVFPIIITLLLLFGASVASAEEPLNQDFPVAPAFNGDVGLFRTTNAYTPLQGNFSTGYHLTFSILNDYPQENVDTTTIEGIAHVGVSLADMIELYFSAGHIANSRYDNDLRERVLSQTLGDLTLGLKAGYDGDIVLHFGVDIFYTLKTNLADLGIDFAAAVFGGKIALSLNFTDLEKPVPLRMHINVAYRKDHSRFLRKTSETSSASFANDIALGIAPESDIFTYSAGIEVPQRYICFFLEWQTEQFMTLQGEPNIEPRAFLENPMLLTPGIRITPVGGLIIDLGADVGLSKPYNPDPDYVLSEEVKSVPDWRAIVGISYFFTPGTVKPPEGKITGLTIDAETKEPIGSVVLEFPGRNLTPLLTPETGRYTTYAFEPGPVDIKASREGYESNKVTVETIRDEIVNQNIELGKLEEIGLITGRVTDTKGAPLASVISFVGTALENVASDPESGVFNGRMPPEVYTVRASANGFLPQTKKVQVVNGKRTTANFVLKSEKAPMGTIKGVVSDADGKPLAAIVSIPDKEQIPPMASNPTNGAYEGKLSPGQYRVQAFAQGFKPATKLVEISEDSETVVDFVLESAVETGMLQGTVTSSKDGSPLFALILSDEDPPKFTQIVTDPETGSFRTQLEAGIYKLKATAQEHRADYKAVEIAKGQTTAVNFELKALTLVTISDKKIEIKEQVHFATGKATIKIESYPLLDEVATVLKDNPTMRVRIEGHTDSVGSDTYNKRLSQMRATSIRDFLIKRGIPTDRLEAVGFGEEMPIASNDSEEGRAKNRRVEFNIIGGGGNNPMP